MIHMAVRNLPTPDVLALLRRLVAEVADEPAARIAKRPSGQPYLPDRPDLAVSMSHDGDWVAAAVGIGVSVGIDVQQPEPVTAGRLRRCGSPEARLALAALPDADREREYARIWAVQEACVKAAGTGLAGRPWSIPVGVGQHHGEWQNLVWHSHSEHGVPVAVAHGLPSTEGEAR